MISTRLTLTLFILGLGLFGCGALPPTSGAGSTALPKLAVDLGTVDAGDRKPFRMTIPVNDALRDTLTNGQFEMHSTAVSLSCVGFGPGYVELAGETHDVRNCTAFGTEAAVLVGGVPVLTLDLKAKVRPAFTITPIVEGTRYALAMAPGVAAPMMIDRSDGLAGTIVPTGKGTAELRLRRERPPRIPGGLVRLLDRASGETRTIELPHPNMEAYSLAFGSVFDRPGEIVLGANSALTPDKPDVEVVLDPPGAYEIVRREYKNGKLTVTLRALTRGPMDVSVGFRRRGRWVEVQRYLVR